MNQYSRSTCPPDTASLLAAAANRQHRSDGEVSFASCLLDEISETLATESIHFWEAGLTPEPRLISWRGVAAGFSELAKQAVPEVVKRIERPSETSNSGSLPRFLTSCEVGNGIQVILELAMQDGVFEPQQMLELVEVLADLHRRNLVSTLFQNTGRAQELHQILALLHADLDPVRVAISLASDPVEFLHCRRISVARRNSRTTWELVAATAVSQPDPRADASRQLCGMIQGACNASSAAVLPEQAAIRLSPTPQGECVQFKLGAHRVQPLSVSGHWLDAEWAAVFEWQSDTDPRDLETDFREICNHAALAFRNCETISKSGAISVLRRLPQKIRSHRVLTVVGLLGAFFAGMTFVEMDLQIEAIGQLVPSKRIFVFAPEDGVITDVFVEDGTIVANESPLCVLRNEDLEIQLESIDGEVASTQARLAALDALRGDRSLTQSGMFAVEQAELKERLNALEAQAIILNRRMARLAINATIAGQVYGDRLQELLRGRPVQRGQYLFELADPSAGWQIDMHVPEVDMRHVINRRGSSNEPLPISFTLETDPEKKLFTSLSRLSASTEIDEFGRLSVLATAIPGKADISNPRPGAGVVGYIHCGKKPAGYILFRRIIESFQRRWWM